MVTARQKEALKAAMCPAAQRLKALPEQGMRPSGYAASTPVLSSTGVIEVDSLTGLELIYHFCKSVYGQVIGNPKSAFAVFDEHSGVVQVFTTANQFVGIEKSPWLEAMYGAMEAAQGKKASFHVDNGHVTCEANGVTAHGGNYPEAAMRAWLKDK